jgi:hypothetical protein
MKKINPVLAAFEYSTMDQARAAWRTVRDDGGFTHLSAWSLISPDRLHFIVGLVGESERQEQINKAAALLMKQPGCMGNFVLPEDMADAMIHRRYSTLAVKLNEWRQANPDADPSTVVTLRQEESGEPRRFPS